MGFYFADSSGLVKRYVLEKGTSTVMRLMDVSAMNEIIIAGVSRVEVIAAIKKKERNGEITMQDAIYAIHQFKIHITGQYKIIDLTNPIIYRAMYLAETRIVRGYDAIQLATALEFNDQLVKEGLPELIFICADPQLIRACILEGLSYLNPA